MYKIILLDLHIEELNDSLDVVTRTVFSGSCCSTSTSCGSTSTTTSTSG